MTQQPTAKSPANAVIAIAKRLETINRATDSLLWATTAYRLGMATAEQPSAHPEQNLRKALGYYEQAGEILTAQRAPLEYARILNAAGSAHRMLGDPAAAAELFEKALALIDGRGSAPEQASILNNLGLVLSESGRLDDAIEAFTRSLDELRDTNDEEVRTRLATMHNLGQAHLGRGSATGCDSAIEVLQDATALAQSIDASMHAAMIDHSLGVAFKAKASIDPEGVDTHLDRAIASFERSLTVFTSVGFPMQHAIAKHNLGHALAGRDDVESLQRALVNYDDALNIFDPRLHRQHWHEAFNNAEAVTVRLARKLPGATRADHTASLVGTMDEPERLMFLRQRFAQMERLPPANQLERLTDFSYAVVTQPAASFVATIRTVITVLMELPEGLLDSALRAQLKAHAMLEPHEQRAADFILDEAINLLLFGPQRIRVRDILESIGWDRP